jgi:hypothetical protein
MKREMTPFVLMAMILAVMALAVFESLNGTNSIAIMVLGITFATWEHFQLERVQKALKEPDQLKDLIDRVGRLESAINLRGGFTKK